MRKEYLENLIEKGVLITLVSSMKRDKNGNRRFSTRLKDLLRREEEIELEKDSGNKRLRFIDINNWRKIIEK